MQGQLQVRGRASDRGTLAEPRDASKPGAIVTLMIRARTHQLLDNANPSWLEQ
jgi:hypothetical protein